MRTLIKKSKLGGICCSILQRFRANRISIVLYLSFECNYSCPYCIIMRSRCFEKYSKESEHSWEKWCRAINNFPPAIVSISGGEPTLFPGLDLLIDNIAIKHKIFLTTNLSQLPNDFLHCKRVGVSASFHPYMTDLNSFKAKIQKLKELGFMPSVECVAYPPLLGKLEELKTFFEKEVNVRLCVDPYISPDYQYTEKEIEILKRVGTRGRKFGFDFEDYGVLKQCDAGSKHFVVIPNGDVYACHAGFYYVTSLLHDKFHSSKEEFYLGNLFDDSFQPLTKPKLCSLPCSEACDLDMAHVKEIGN